MREVAALLLILGALVDPAPGQPPAIVDPSRRETFTPGLVLDTEGRNSACDVLTFTHDGQYLLAAGDDKVVRNWAFTPQGLRPSPLPKLRWPIFREVRGNIYAMALSPDAEQRHVAIAGHGLKGAGYAAAVVDRLTGRTVHGLDPILKDQRGTIWAIDFSPSGRKVALGTQRGSIWIWDLDTGAAREIGNYGFEQKTIDAFKGSIRLVAFVDDTNLVSVAGDGRMLHWNLQGGPPRLLHQFAGPITTPVVLSPDRKWIGAVIEPQKTHQNVVEVVSFPAGRARRPIAFPPGTYPHRLAFRHDSRLLAIAVRQVDQTASFFSEQGGFVRFHDLVQDRPSPFRDLPQSLYAEGLAFHPRHANLLAVAGGSNHEITVWDYETGRRLGEDLRTAGSSLWGVAMSADTRYLAFQENRNPRAPHPNARGQGPWKFFDFQTRQFVDGQPFRPEPPRDTANGWKVLTRLPNSTSADAWFVQKGNGLPIPLPWNRLEDEFPRCYTFLPAKDGKPDRLLVGHYWGASIFELTDKSVRRVRLLKGHEGYVTSHAVSADQKKLVTASRDQTVAGWSLEDWPSHPNLGGVVFAQQNGVWVGAIDAGSPMWEVGLSPGDEIQLLVVDRQIIYNRLPKYGKAVGTPEAAVAALAQPSPGKEHYFGWRRPGDATAYEQLTTVLDRPLWRFFPTRDKEWVLWRWRDYYYDTSTNGDFHIGWQRSFTIQQTPVFYRAEQFRNLFLRPDLVADALANWKGNQSLTRINTIEPPRVEVEASSHDATATDVRLTVRLTPRGTLKNHQPARVLVWLNDHRFKVWDQAELKRGDGSFSQSLLLPRETFRRGENLVTVQCYNQAGVRAEAAPVAIRCARPARPANLYGLVVGVGNYARTRPRLVDLASSDDAAIVERVWKAQKGKLFADARLEVLTEDQVTPQRVLGLLESFAAQVRPDDLFVFHLGGHGVRLKELHEELKIPKSRTVGLGNYLFVCPDFTTENLYNTTISFKQLSDRLVTFPCHKLLLLDACHSGAGASKESDAESNPIRILTSDGVGPIILAACTPEQSAQEEATVDLAGGAAGFFTIALRKLLEDEPVFAKSDANGNGVLEAGEMYEGVRTQVRAIVDQLRRERVQGLSAQDPVGFVPRLLESLPLAGK